MKDDLPAVLNSQEATLTTGQALRATGIFAAGAVATIALCIGAFHLGFQSASARIYERIIAPVVP